jgi:tetratricopeptide (TPR) repeat protein
VRPGGVLLALGATTLLTGAILAWNAVRQERQFRVLLAAGDTALVRDDTVDAIEAFSGALALKGDSMVAHLKRGDSYRRRGELAAALRDLREAARLDDTAPRPAELLGDVNIALGRFERGAEEYRRFVSLDEREPRVWYKLGLALYQDGQAAQAVDPLRRAVGLDDRLAEGHYLLGVCLRLSDRNAEALKSLQRAVSLNPALAAAREELADLDRSLGRVRERLEQLEALAVLDTRPERLVDLALAYAAAGRLDGAVATLTRAAERYPSSAVVPTALGRVWLEEAEGTPDAEPLRKAVDILRPIAARTNASGETLALYGRALLRSGDVAGAELVLRQAALRTPIVTASLVDLAEAADRLGHRDVARDAQRRYAAINEGG